MLFARFKRFIFLLRNFPDWQGVDNYSNGKTAWVAAINTTTNDPDDVVIFGSKH